MTSGALQQCSSLPTLIFPFSISPILLALLQQTKSDALLLSLFTPQGDEKSLAVALCWPVLLVGSHPAFSVHWPFLCVCVFPSVCFTSHCFVKWFVLTVLPWPATIVARSSLVSYTDTHIWYTYTNAGLSSPQLVLLANKEAMGHKRALVGNCLQLTDHFLCHPCLIFKCS